MFADMQPASMDPRLKTSMLTYYDERAPEYDELYTKGAVPGTSIAPQIRLREVESLSEIASAKLRGSVLDAPCGAGFWMVSYAAGCDAITLLDQSPKMLAESQKKAALLGISDRVETRQVDLLSFDFPENRFDSVLIAFLLSHLTDEEMDHFMTGVRRACRKGGTVVVFDSIWSTARQANGDKSGTHRRRLKDGREFDIYKRYFAPEDLTDFRRRYGISLEIDYAAEAYIAASGTLTSSTG
jgi:SAM-dependent methyltransferase